MHAKVVRVWGRREEYPEWNLSAAAVLAVLPSPSSGVDEIPGQPQAS